MSIVQPQTSQAFGTGSDLTPEWLLRARSTSQQGQRMVSDDSIANYISSRDSKFRDRWERAKKEQVRFADDAGNEIPLSTALLNHRVFGNFRTSWEPPKPQYNLDDLMTKEEQSASEESWGQYLAKNVGGVLSTANDYLQAPGRVHEGITQYAVSSMFGEDPQKRQSVQNIDENLKKSGTVARYGIPAIAAAATGGMSIPATMAVEGLASGAGAAADLGMQAAAGEDVSATEFGSDVLLNTTIGALTTGAFAWAQKSAGPIMRSVLGITPSQAGKIALPNVAGEAPEKFLLKNGYSGTLGGMANSLAKSAKASKKKVDAALKSIPGTFQIAPTEVATAQTAKKFIPEAADALDEIISYYSKAPKGNEKFISKITNLRAKNSLSLSELNYVKRQLAGVSKAYRASGDPLKTAIGEGHRNLYNSIKTFIEDRAAESGNPLIKKFNKNTQVATSIASALRKTMERQVGQKILTLGNVAKLSGAIGYGLTTGDWMSAVGLYLGAKATESPLVMTNLARGLSSSPTGAAAPIVSGIKDFLQFYQSELSDSANDAYDDTDDESKEESHK